MNTTSLNPPSLVHAFDLSVRISAPIELGVVQGLGYGGKRRIIPIVGGEVRGRINGVILPGGADFQIVVNETCTDLDARYALQLDDGSHVFMMNHAVRVGSAADVAALVRGEFVDPARIYFRCVPRFEVSNPEHAWLTERVFVGTGERYPDGVKISVFEVT